jgi:enamine deaminase RidA (YjgF/YER057c/UK114 family)
MNQVYAARWPKDPPARTTVVVLKPLTIPDALVEMSLVAVPNGADRHVVHPSDWIKSPNPYSYGIRTGNMLFMSGLLSRSGKDNTAVKGDVADQTKVVLENGAQILAAAGMGLDDVVSARVFLRDGAHFDAMNKAYRPFFPADPPARATVVTGLTAPDYLVEITMVAVKDPSRAAVGPAKGAASNYSTAMKAGNRIFLSGVLAAPGRIGGASQTADALAQIKRTLESGGFGVNDVADVIVYVSDMDAVADINRSYREVLSSAQPARTVMGADVIAREAVVEIMLSAAK